jgi:hypothetical protein
LSRAGLSAEVLDLAEEILADLGQAERLSRTGLRRRMRRNVLKTLLRRYRSSADLGQDPPLSRTGLDP